MAAVTVSELVFGFHRAATAARPVRRENFLEALLEAIPVLPFDLRTARVYGRIWAEMAAMGQMIGPHDTQIAAAGLAHGYGVLTDNAKHFEQVPELVVTPPQ